jgi:predicted NAD-dependent protein-ADP-ribosyltransferase YbiA (DUF1768 family)
LPGKGPGEKIQPSDVKHFSSLSHTPQWRKKLSNAWVQPFKLDNHTWSTVDHYMQASKFKKNNPELYRSFSLETNNELSKNVAMAKAMGSKTSKYNGEKIRPDDVEIDPDYYGVRYEKEKLDATLAKFGQHDDLKQLLVSTHPAKLQLQKRGKLPETSETLMQVREKLRQG